MKTRILFLCTGNSCRSQMAEGWAKQLKGDAIEAYSAGVEPHGMNARAVAVMKEAGVDISSHRSKHVDELKDVLGSVRRDIDAGLLQDRKSTRLNSSHLVISYAVFCL